MDGEKLFSVCALIIMTAFLLQRCHYDNELKLKQIECSQITEEVVE